MSAASNKLDQEVLTITEFKKYLENSVANTVKDQTSLKIKNIVDDTIDQSVSLSRESCTKIKSLRIENLSLSSHQFVYKNVLQFSNLEELAILIPETEKDNLKFDFASLQHFFNNLDALPNLKFLELEFHPKVNEDAEAIFKEFLIGGRHIKKKKIKISEIDFINKSHHNKNELTNSQSAQTAELHLYIAGKNLRNSGEWFSIIPELRSEERRVGKECRSRWSPYH